MNRWGFIPPWAPLLVMVAVVFTGVVLGEAGTVFVALFFFSCVVCTALVELRGLFLTVVAVPFYWFAGTGLVGFFTNRAAFSGSGRKTAVITALYPAVENYLWLVATFFVSLVVAVVRQRLDAAARERARRLARDRRRRAAQADMDNRRVVSRVRDIERSAPGSREEPGGTGDGMRMPGVQPASKSVSSPRHLASEEVPGTPGVHSSPDFPGATDGARIRTAEELRAASERRRSRSSAPVDPDRPLDLD